MKKQSSLLFDAWGALKQNKAALFSFATMLTMIFFGYFWPNAKPLYGRPNRLVSVVS